MSSHDADTNPSDRLYRAAQLYYEEGATQADIAAHLGVSRPSVSRLLSEARAQGIVQITLHRPAERELDELSEKLAHRLAIDAVHLALGNQSHQVGPGLAPQARQALHAAGLHSGDVLLVASGETVHALAQHGLGELHGVVVAPTVGGQAEPDPWHQTNEVVRSLTAHSGGYPHYLFAPSMPSPALHAALQDDFGFRQIRHDWENAAAALVGIGAPPASRHSIASSVPRDDPGLANAVGDVCLAFFDGAGTELEFSGNERMIRIPGDTLRQVPMRIAAAVGSHKVRSITAAAAAGWFNVLVTDESTARALLNAS